jgi:hypothetical protein
MADIVVLGWGSPIWNPEGLLLKDGDWRERSSIRITPSNT